jgi:hypothetical protein
MTVRNPLVLIPNGNPQIQELPSGDSIGGAMPGPTGATGPQGTSGTNGASALQYTQVIGDGVSTSIAVTHNLGTRDVDVTVVNASTFQVLNAPDWTATSTSVVTFAFSGAPSSNQYRVIIQAGNAVGSGVTASVNVYFA